MTYINIDSKNIQIISRQFLKEENQLNILKYLRELQFKNVLRVDRAFKNMMQE